MARKIDSIRAYLLEQLQRNRELRQAAQLDEGPQRMAAALRIWQVQRLSETFADLVADSGYKEATEFFLNDLYSVDGFDSRDDDLERIVPIMIRLLPGHLIETVGKAMELQALSQELDLHLAELLQEKGVAPGEITVADYAWAYQASEGRASREHQIDLICQVGRELHAVVDKSFVYTALKLCRRPARAAGLADLQTFLENGFHAYRSMEDPAWFLETIEQRERRILERLMADHPDPFNLDEVRRQSAG
jgi:hypothetical protein